MSMRAPNAAHFATFLFLFANNFPFKYHKRDTKSRLMYLDEPELKPKNRKNKTCTHTTATRQWDLWQTEQNPKHTHTYMNARANPGLQCWKKHNINTNLQSCNNFLKFLFLLWPFFVSIQRISVQFRGRLLFHFSSSSSAAVVSACFVKISPYLWLTWLGFHFLNSI